jgi:hypothetical protein
VANGNTWTLRLWSHGTLEGSANAKSGLLTVAVPATSDCAFQADVTELPASGQRFPYSGNRATVPGCGPAATIAGHIYLCDATGAPTTTEVPGGTLASTGPQTVGSHGNPLGPMTVGAGTYTMSATSPDTYVFVICGGTATVATTGTTATEPVTVPSGGAGVGTFYVVLAAPTGSLGGGTNPGSPTGVTSSNGPPTSPGTSGPVKVARPSATRVGSSAHLAFTGLDTRPLLLSGVLALAFGTLATGVSRRRRRQRAPAHSRS